MEWWPCYKGRKNGVPLILDNINFSKPHVIECLNPLLEENSKYNNVEYNILEKENEGPIQIKSGFSIIGTMNLNKENKNTISKALMNRFVAIYVDNDIEINNQNLNFIIENSCKKLNKQIQEINRILIYDKDNDINDNNDDDLLIGDVFGGQEGNEDDKKNKIKEEKNEIPEWYNIRGISNKTLKEIKQCIKKENIEGKNMKSIIKMIEKLALVYERIYKFGFTINDCDAFINLNFSDKEEIYKNLQNNILFDSEKKK